MLEFKPVARRKLLVSVSLQMFYTPCDSTKVFIGLQVNIKPEVRSVGVQCSMTEVCFTTQDVGVQCSLKAPVRPPTSVALPYTSSPLPSDTSQSESEMDFETPDLETSAYTLQDDTSS